MKKSKLKIFLSLATFLLSLCLITVFVLGKKFIQSQRIPDRFWKDFKVAKVQFDQHGIPTIRSDDWDSLIKAQGYVVASDRLWQMDLLRRKASGRLSEWFGEKAFEHDKEIQEEDRIRIAHEAAERLPEQEKHYCNVYAQGVNDFIFEQRAHWGIEYKLLDTEPEPWSCKDTILILITMNSQLTRSADVKSIATAWSEHLPKPWIKFLFPKDHRWNKALFHQSEAKGPMLPTKQDWLPQAPLAKGEYKKINFEVSPALGSNSWAYRGQAQHFLANDPHLKQSVPGIWYAMKLIHSKEQWVAGVSLPGIPGVILGMNKHRSWGFTNTGEDVDDLLEEQLSADKKHYLDHNDRGDSYWRPIQIKEFTIKVKGEKTPRKIRSGWTHRGPLKQYNILPNKIYSRQWLSLKPQYLRLPILDFAKMSTQDDFHQTVSSLSLPSQNIISMDRLGHIAYRTSGTGVIRHVESDVPIAQSAKDGEWLGYEKSHERPQLNLELGSDKYFLATANERIWESEHHHFWSSDDRKHRIRKYLAGSKHLGEAEMDQLMLDTHSEFRKTFLTWIMSHSDREDTQGLHALISDWDGSSQSSSHLFYKSSVAENKLVKLILARLIDQYFPKGHPQITYKSRMQRAWLLELITQENSFEAFGLNTREVANFLMEEVISAEGEHHLKNRWQAQHPFVGGIPILGKLFAVKTPPQYGSFDTVNAEQPEIGPSVRLLWNMSDPKKSSWILPVGQSGHIGSPFYDHMQSLWHSGQKLQVFNSEEIDELFPIES